MGNVHHPHRGSMQFWPRSRSRHSITRIRSWTTDAKAKLAGFIGYKAGMTHVIVTDNRPKSLTKGEQISLPVTIIDCPPLSVVGVCFYKKQGAGIVKFASVLAEKLPKYFSRATPIPKKQTKKIDEISGSSDLRLLVCSHPHQTSTGTKKPKLLEVALGGSFSDKLAYAKSVLGKEIAVADVFEKGLFVDVKGISKGKGFQGTVKRYGVPIRQHKAEKTKRGIANLGSWTPKRIEYTVANTGKMGYHSRTEYNKQIIKVGTEGKEVVPAGGITKYGLVSGSYVLVHGSVVGPRKRAVVLTNALRAPPKVNKESFEVVSII